MQYEFKELCAGPSWRRVLGPFDRRSQCEAHAIDWLQARDLRIVCREIDAENDAIDLMTARGDSLYQYAIEPIR